MAELPTHPRQIVRSEVLVLGVMLALTGCEPPAKPPARPEVEFAAVQLIAYEKCSDSANALLKDVFTGHIIGKALDEYPDMASAKPQREAHGERQDTYRFDLPTDDAVLSKLYPNSELMHSPALMLFVDRETGRIERANLYLIIF